MLKLAVGGGGGVEAVVLCHIWGFPRIGDTLFGGPF